MSLIITANMVKNYQRVKQLIRVKANPVMIIGDSSTSRGSLLKLDVWLVKRTHLDLLYAFDDNTQGLKEFQKIFMKSILATILISRITAF